MAGLAATRLFAAAGAGGVALTAWALRRSGMEPRLVACRMVAFIVLLYVVYAGSLLIDGIGLGIGPVPRRRLVRDHDRAGDRRRACCSRSPARSPLLPGDVERRLRALGVRARAASRTGSPGRSRCRRSAASGVRTAIELIRSRDPGLLGAPAWWGFDIAVLWAMFHAFGSPPPFTVI